MPAFLENFFLAMHAVQPKVGWSICHCGKIKRSLSLKKKMNEIKKKYIYIYIWTGLKSKATVEESAFCLMAIWGHIHWFQQEG